MTILDFMNKSGLKSFKKYDGEIGLEIETETKSADAYPTGTLVLDDRSGHYKVSGLKYWDTHTDGSLRDFGLEFVLKQPVRFHKELPAALEEFRERLGKVKFIKDSVTTSVHVHLNMLNESFRTLGNFLTLYTLFENILIRYSGPDRLSNLFCLPICDAEDTYKNIVNMMQNIERKNYKSLFFNETNVKYAALNLGAFSSYGSMEVRSFRGETDTKAIEKWVGILYSLVEYARQGTTPKEIMLSWKDKQGKLLDEVFKDYRKEIAHIDELKLVDRNVWYAGSIAYGVKNWNSLDEVVKPPEFKPKQKELDMMAAHYFSLGWLQLDNAQQDHIIKKLKADYDKKYLNGEVQKYTVNDWEDNPAIQPVAVPPLRPRAQPMNAPAGAARQAGRQAAERALQAAAVQFRDNFEAINPVEEVAVDFLDIGGAAGVNNGNGRR